MWKKKLAIFYLFWFMILLVGPFTVFKNSETPLLFKNSLYTITFFQRILGTLAITSLAIQVIIGSLMEKWIQTLGSKAYRIHIVHGITFFFVLLLHPIMQVLIDFNLGGFKSAMLSLFPGRDIYLNFGKLALVVIILVVVAGYFRTRKGLRDKWRVIHLLSYFAFIFVFIHSWFLGTDVKTQPFYSVYILSGLVVTTLLVRRFILPIFSKVNIFSPTSDR